MPVSSFNIQLSHSILHRPAPQSSNRASNILLCDPTHSLCTCLPWTQFCISLACKTITSEALGRESGSSSCVHVIDIYLAHSIGLVSSCWMNEWMNKWMEEWVEKFINELDICQKSTWSQIATLYYTSKQRCSEMWLTKHEMLQVNFKAAQVTRANVWSPSEPLCLRRTWLEVDHVS